LVFLAVISDGNLKVKIIAGKIYLPKDLRLKANLPDNWVCEAILVGDEIKLRGEIPRTLNIIEAVRNPRAELSKEEMMKAEEVEYV